MFNGQFSGNPNGITRNVTHTLRRDQDDSLYRQYGFTPLIPGINYRLFVDGKEIAGTNGTEFELPYDIAARAAIEVFESFDHLLGEDLTKFALTPLHKVKLTWDDVTDAASYDVWRSTAANPKVTGAIVANVVDNGEDSFLFTDQNGTAGGLDDATYHYVVAAKDAANNYTNSNEVNVTVNRAPEPVTNLALSYSNPIKTVTLTWTAPSDSDLGNYNLYRSAAVDQTIPLTTAYATPASSPWTEVFTNETGRLEYLVRAKDSVPQEEKNIRQVVVLNLINGLQVLKPNAPYSSSATPAISGQAVLKTYYNRKGEQGVATLIRWFKNNGLGGAVDWVTSIGNTNLLPTVKKQSVTYATAGLTGGLTYLFGARAETADAQREENTDTFSCLTDDSPPGAITITATVI